MLQTFHYNYYWWSQSLLNRLAEKCILFKGSNNLVQIYRSFAITGNYGRRNFSKYGISYYMFTTADVIIHASNRQIWYRHPNKENTKVRTEMTKFKISREKVNMDFYCVGITFKNTGRWYKFAINSGQKERLCLIIDKYI